VRRPISSIEENVFLGFDHAANLFAVGQVAYKYLLKSA
jgi:hypothetical protein